MSGCKKRSTKDLRVRAPAAPVLTHSLWTIFYQNAPWCTVAETNVACSSFGTFLHLFFVAFKSHIAAATAAPLALTLCSEGLFYNIALRMLDDHVLLDCKNPSLNIRRGQLRSFRVLWGTLLLNIELRKSVLTCTLPKLYV